MHSSTQSIRDVPAKSGARLRPRAAFTLLEILLTIAIIALLATVLIGGSARLLTQQPMSVEDVFWKAVQEARKAALKSEHEMRLKWDKEKKQFLLFDGLAQAGVGPAGLPIEETPLKTFPVPAEAATDLTVDILGPTTKGVNTILVGGMLLENNPLTSITFFGDGTCNAFRLQLARLGGSRILSVDPWTCAPVLTPADKNTP